MPTPTGWECDRCHAQYGMSHEAEDCERTHNKICHVDAVFKVGEKIPQEIKIEFIGHDNDDYPVTKLYRLVEKS